MARKQKAKELRTRRPVLVSAGITERLYFKHLAHIKGYNISPIPRFSGNDTPFYMDKYVSQVLADNGIAVCVYDMDEAVRADTIRKKLAEFVNTYNANPNVILCGSMPSIEYWFLLHFEKTNRYFGSSDKVIEALQHYMPFEKTERFLKQPAWVQRLLSEDRMQHAIENAEELGTDGESYTQIPDAIRFLEERK